MKKVLFSATVDSHILAFHIPYLKFFKDSGYEVHVASNGNADIPYADKKYNIPFERSPFRLGNVIAYKDLNKIIYTNKYEIIHCHTPICGALTRLAARKARKSGTKVIYTAHGFHFYAGAPVINWILYYPVEKWLSKYTDCLITINKEDYTRALKHNFYSNNIKYVHGVGVDLLRFCDVSNKEKIRLRYKHGYNPEQFILFFAGELNKNKNQAFLIKVVDKLKDSIPNVKLILAGDGKLYNEYKNLICELHVEDYIDLVGFRNDVNDFIALSDVVVSSSLREGLPLNVMEAMACSKPLVVTNIRGHKDLIEDGVNGFLINNMTDMEKNIYLIYKNSELAKYMGLNSRQLANQYYCIDQIRVELSNIYSCYMN